MWLLQPFCLKRADYWRMALRLLDMCLSVGWQSSREQITIDHETPFSYCLSHDFKHSVTVIMHLLHVRCSSSKSKFVIVIIVINLLRSWVIKETLILWGILIPFEQYEKNYKGQIEVPQGDSILQPSSPKSTILSPQPTKFFLGLS